ncbi:unnamed protein product, partial [Owenia fusiformis]
MEKIIFILLGLCIVGAFGEDDDPCVSHSLLTNNGERSAGVRLDVDTRPPLSDKQALIPGWYRVNSPGGNEIPNMCVDLNYCSTNFPIWMNDVRTSFPPNRVVDIEGCVHTRNGCCGEKLRLKVKNCRDFNVYKLVKPPG